MSERKDKKTDPAVEKRTWSDDGKNGAEPKAINLDLTRQEVRQGARAGDRYVRVVRPYGHLFQRVGPGYLRATEEALEPKTPFRRIYLGVKHILIGEPLPTHAEITERLTKVKALAIFASDAMSSVAYATEEILFVLALAAASGGLNYGIPIAFAVAFLIASVAFSYRQTVFAYPNGGGSYVVSKENLGLVPGLTAASALMLDYILTVAVSIAAGTAALTSAFPELIPFTVLIALAFIALMVLGNLRGIRESGNIFAAPTYVFIFSLGALILVGIWRIVTNQPLVETPALGPRGAEPVTLWLLLTAFSAGSVASSGIEAIANGVPAFKPSESKNAATTLTAMALILGAFFLGISFLASHYGLVVSEGETIVSQLGRVIFGKNLVYYVIQFATMLILVLAANTAFNGFPRLAWVMAQDGFMPRQFAFRGDRLAFSVGIGVLGGLAALLIVAFQGDTHLLIPLYAVGVFLAFTLSQIGMVVHWRRERSPGWQRNVALNGFGAVLAAVALAIAATTKFLHGAWLIVLMIPTLVVLFLLINKHYRAVAAQLQLPAGQPSAKAITPIVLVPIANLNLASQRALDFARSISKQVNVIHIANTPEEAAALQATLRRVDPDVKVVVLESPYRAFLDPLLLYIDALHQQDPEAFITVIVPEFITAHWWERLLHNGTADRLNRALKSHPNVAVVNVPYVLQR